MNELYKDKEIKNLSHLHKYVTSVTTGIDSIAAVS